MIIPQRFVFACLIGLSSLNTMQTAEAAAEKTGLFCWNKAVVSDASQSDQLLAFMDSGADSTLVGGRIILNAASMGDGAYDSQKFADFIMKADAEHHRVSLMVASDAFVASPTQISSIAEATSRFLDCLNTASWQDSSGTPHTWKKNLDANDHPMIEVFLEVEPQDDSSAYGGYLSVLQTTRASVDSHNSNGPVIKASLGASMTIAGVISDHAQDLPCPGTTEKDCWECAFGMLDRMVLMAYRNVPCYLNDMCTGTLEGSHCAPGGTGQDGILYFAFPVLNWASSNGKLASIALEVNQNNADSNLADCHKISFGTDGIWGMGTTGRRQYMQDVKDACTAALSGGFDPDSYFTINDYNGHYCFVNNAPCISGDCYDANASCAGCTPILPPYMLTGDVNGDGQVNTLDLHEMQRLLGTGPHDTNFNGTVEILDLLNLISIWNAHYPEEP